MPRRRAGTGIDLGASVSENLLIDFEGNVRLTSKNQMQNPLLNEFTPTGELKGWALDRPPEETGYSVYGGPLNSPQTKQASYPPEQPFHEQNQLLISGASPPDAAHQSPVNPYAGPPIVELVAATGGKGFPAGWWAVAYAFGTLPNWRVTNLGPVLVFFLNSGEGFRLTMPTSVPAGTDFVTIGQNGPYATQVAAQNVTAMWWQGNYLVRPRLPATLDFLGPMLTTSILRFDLNQTYLPPPPPPPPPTPPPSYPPPAAPAAAPAAVAAAKKSNPGNNNKKRGR